MMTILPGAASPRLSAGRAMEQTPSAPPPQQQPPAPQQPPPTGQTPAPTPVPPVTPPLAPPQGTVVIDPGHGGTDAGARGSTGILEKDVAMSLAQLLRAALERQGMRVVMTRHAGGNPPYDDRAATANAHRGAVTVALHVSSTGTPGTARAYYSAAGAAPPAPVAPAIRDQTQGPPPSQPSQGPPPIGLTRWEDAQRAHLASSKRLAESVQTQIKQRLDKSADAPASASLRDLRSVAGAAVAVELASVSVKDRRALDPFLAPLAEAIARGVAAYRGVPAASAGGAR